MNSPFEQYNAVKNSIQQVVENAAHYRDLTHALNEVLRKFGIQVRPGGWGGYTVTSLDGRVVSDEEKPFITEWEAFVFAIGRVTNGQQNPA